MVFRIAAYAEKKETVVKYAADEATSAYPIDDHSYLKKLSPWKTKDEHQIIHVNDRFTKIWGNWQKLFG